MRTEGNATLAQTIDRATLPGFTLLEVIAVVAIISLLTAVALPRLLNRIDAARRDQARVSMERIRVALEMYHADHGGFPTTRQGLAALCHMPEIEPKPRTYPPRGYLPEGLPTDPWNNPFEYQAERDKPNVFALRCLGADGQPGGAGRDADIVLPN